MSNPPTTTFTGRPLAEAILAKELQAKLHETITHSRARLENRGEEA